MKHFLVFTQCLTFILITSCQKEIVEIPDTGRKLVIYGLLSTDSLISTSISRSYSWNEME
jgi:hypothetical protein